MNIGASTSPNGPRRRCPVCGARGGWAMRRVRSAVVCCGFTYLTSPCGLMGLSWLAERQSQPMTTAATGSLISPGPDLLTTRCHCCWKPVRLCQISIPKLALFRYKASVRFIGGNLSGPIPSTFVLFVFCLCNTRLPSRAYQVDHCSTVIIRPQRAELSQKHDLLREFFFVVIPGSRSSDGRGRPRLPFVRSSETTRICAPFRQFPSDMIGGSNESAVA